MEYLIEEHSKLNLVLTQALFPAEPALISFPFKGTPEKNLKLGHSTNT